MSSLTCNSSRANSRRCSRTLSVAVALTLVSGVALANGTHRFVFTAYSDSDGGAEVIAGRYRVALKELAADAGNLALDPSALDTNQCVAYSMTLQWQQAHTACDAAIRAASTQRNPPPAWWKWSHEADGDYLALAYANRAVLEWMLSDEAAARKDIAKAQEIAPQADFVVQNLVALETHAEVAQAHALLPKG